MSLGFKLRIVEKQPASEIYHRKAPSIIRAQGLPGISITIHTCVPVDDAYNNTVYRPPYT